VKRAYSRTGTVHTHVIDRQGQGLAALYVPSPQTSKMEQTAISHQAQVIEFPLHSVPPIVFQIRFVEPGRGLHCDPRKLLVNEAVVFA